MTDKERCYIYEQFLQAFYSARHITLDHALIEKWLAALDAWGASPGENADLNDPRWSEDARMTLLRNFRLRRPE